MRTSIDIAMTLDGDLKVADNGDLEISSGTDWLIQEINKVVRTTNPLWKTHPTIGAGVGEFIGRQNTKDVADELAGKIKDSLRAAEVVTLPDDISVDVVPTSATTAVIYISVLSGGYSTPVTKLIVDYDKGIAIPQDEEEPLATSSSRFVKNKYLERISNLLE